MSRKIWIATGIVATAVGVTALAAHAQRGEWNDDGYNERRGGWERDYRDGRGWQDRRRGDKMSKEDFDAETRSIYGSWDANADGVVDSKEAEAAITRRMERRHGGGERHHMRKVARRYDANNDGKVTLEEVQTKITERFAKIDLDGDGKITDADLPPMARGRKILSGGDQARGHHHWGHGRHHGGPGKRMLRYLRGADANKDDVVTLQELQDRAAARFARLDQNKDGAVDNADRDMMKKAMMEYRVQRFMHRFGGKDGKLTLEQFSTYRADRFAKRDQAGDAVMSHDDMRGPGGWRDDRGWSGDNDRNDYRDERRDPGESGNTEPAPEKPINQ